MGRRRKIVVTNPIAARPVGRICMNNVWIVNRFDTPYYHFAKYVAEKKASALAGHAR